MQKQQFFPCHMTKKLKFPSVLLWWSQNFVRIKNAESVVFSMSHDQKPKLSVKYIYFLRWTQNFVRFALAFTFSQRRPFAPKTQYQHFFKVTWPKMKIFRSNVFFPWSKNVVHFVLDLTVSKLRPFWAKNTESAFFQGHMTKNENFPSKHFFP